MCCGGAAERYGPPGLRAFRNRESQRAGKSAKRTNDSHPTRAARVGTPVIAQQFTAGIRAERNRSSP